MAATRSTTAAAETIPEETSPMAADDGRVQGKILESLQTLINRVDRLDAKIDRCDRTIENIKDSMDTCLNNSYQALVISRHNRKEVLHLKEELAEERSRSTHLEHRVIKLQDKVVKLEAQARQDNLLLEGVPENPRGENCEHLVRDIFRRRLLLVDADYIRLVKCQRVGSMLIDNEDDTPRPILLKFHWHGDRTKVWNARTKLYGSGMCLNEDFSFLTSVKF